MSASNHLEQTSTINFFGFYRAKVIDAKDLKYLGRVKVWIPDIMITPDSDELAKGINEWEQGLWAHPANIAVGGRNVPDGTNSKLKEDSDATAESWYQGQCLIPPKGSWTWIFFEKGDPNHPYYFGAGEFGQIKVMPENQLGEEYWKKWTLFKSRQGRCVIISDDESDCRVEITGKKRKIKTKPDGDLDSVYAIDENQTVILLDEREGNEKLLIKDYHGNFINMRTNDKDDTVDQLHIFFKNDIHIETEKNMFIKTGEKMHIETGDDYLLHSKKNIHTKSDTDHFETTTNFHRVAHETDRRFAKGLLSDESEDVTILKTGCQYIQSCGGDIHRTCQGDINDFTKGSIKYHATNTIDFNTDNKLSITGLAGIDIYSSGQLNIDAMHINSDCGISQPAQRAEAANPVVVVTLAKEAIPAKPTGERNQEKTVPKPEQEPAKELDKMPPPNTEDIKIDKQDPYIKTVRTVDEEKSPEKFKQSIINQNKKKDIQQQIEDQIISSGDLQTGSDIIGQTEGTIISATGGVITSGFNFDLSSIAGFAGIIGGLLLNKTDKKSGYTIPTTSSPQSSSMSISSGSSASLNVTDSPQPKIIINSSQRLIGLGHMFAINLKDEYRSEILPLIKDAGGTHTGFYINREYSNTFPESVYLDDMFTWNNYDAPEDWEDWNNQWWDRFDEFLDQAYKLKITVVPSLFDFCCSPNDPLLTNINHDPYSTLSWSDPQKLYVSKIAKHLKDSKVKYIINLGVKSYNKDQNIIQDYLPAPGYIRKLIMYLVRECKIPSKDLSLTATENRNLYSMNPLTRYKSYTGDKIPYRNEINYEECVGDAWGGTGSIEETNGQGEITGGYVKFLNDSMYGIPILNTWKMSSFDDGNHIMEEMFAPTQRAAMKRVLKL